MTSRAGRGDAVAVLLIGLAVAVGGLGVAPPLLGRAGWGTRRPDLALGVWCAVLVGGLLALLATFGWVLLLAVDRQQGAVEGNGTVAAVVVIAGWAALAAAGGLGSLVLTRAEPLVADRQHTDALLTLLAATSTCRREWLGPTEVLHVDSDLPFAASIPGGAGRILVTSRLVGALTPPQLRAVLEHERAHLSGRHGWVARLVRLHAGCLPRLRGADRFERTCRLLVELAADDAAARVCGAEDVAAALTAVAALSGDEGALLRARRVATNPPRRARVAAGARRAPVARSGEARSGEG